MAVTRKSPNASSRPSTARSKRDKTRDPTTRPATERGGSGGTGMTEGRAFENLLRSDPELLRSLVDQAADALCLHQIDGRILDVNRRMCTTLGYSREELLTLSRPRHRRECDRGRNGDWSRRKWCPVCR